MYRRMSIKKKADSSSKKDASPRLKGDLTTKDGIKDIELNLQNLIEVTEAIYAKLEEQNIKSLGDKTIVLSLGSTGCGKSTMFASLVHGPEALETKRIQNPTTNRRGG